MDAIEYFKKNKYVHIPKMIVPDLANFIYNYLVIKACTNLEFEPNATLDNKYVKCCYGDLCSESLLGMLLETIEKVTQKNLCPTYSYTRLYTRGEILKPHTDRPSCQFSITMNFGGDPWPIFFGKKNKNTLDDGYSLLNEIIMEPGDGVVYMGEDLVHWRNKFEGDHCAQSFLHYIDVDGPHYPEHKYDGRKNIGYTK